MSAELYALLELEPEADREEVRHAYFRLAKTLHPDRQADDDPEATERFLEIQRAYEILMDPRRKSEYEEEAREKKASEPSSSTSRTSVMGARPSVGPTEEELRDAEIAFHRAQDFLVAGKSAQALRAMQAVVRTAPRFPRYRSLLGYCLALESQNLHAARDHCRYAVEAEPFEADHQARLGYVYQQAGLQRTADQCFDAAMAIEPGNPIAIRHSKAHAESGGLFKSVRRIFGGS